MLSMTDRQEAFERANPHLQFRTHGGFRSLGGLLVRNSGSRSGLTHIQGSIWGQLGMYEQSLSNIAIDHPRMYWCADVQRYVLTSHPYAWLPEVDKHGAVYRLLQQVQRVNQAHLQTNSGKRNGEQLCVYYRDTEYSWYHDTTILVVVASDSVSIDLSYFG